MDTRAHLHQGAHSRRLYGAKPASSLGSILSLQNSGKTVLDPKLDVEETGGVIIARNEVFTAKSSIVGDLYD